MSYGFTCVRCGYQEVEHDCGTPIPEFSADMKARPGYLYSLANCDEYMPCREEVDLETEETRLKEGQHESFLGS